MALRAGRPYGLGMSRFRGRVALVLCIVLGCAAATIDGVGAATRAEDEALAAGLVLTSDDFPDAWTSTDNDDSPDYDSLGRIPACRRFLDPLREMVATPHDSSPAFSGEASTLQNSVYVYPSVRAAKRAMSSFGHRNLARCFERSFEQGHERALAEDPSLGEGLESVEFSARRTPGADGNKLIGYIGRIEINRSDGTVGDRAFGYLAVRAGRAITDLNYSIGSDAGNDVLRDVGQVAIERLEAAL